MDHAFLQVIPESQKIELFFWYVPDRTRRAGERKTRHRMSREDAAKVGALRPDLASRMVITEPETPDEQAEHRRASDTARHY